ncbi:hypothetical protein ACQRIT_001768 [Beauveria bassiana]
MLYEDPTSEILIFEQRSNVGGIWNTDATSSHNDVAAVPSPIHPGMESNIPSVMQFDTPISQGNAVAGRRGTSAQHIFHVDHPNLAFVMLHLRVVAFPFAESQAAVIARVWSGRLRLPPYEEMANWVEINKKSRGEDNGFHKLSYPADAECMNAMYRWCMSAEGETESHLRPPF